MSRIPRRLSATCFALVLGAAALGCGRAKEDEGPRYGESPLGEAVEDLVFAVHPLYNPAQLFHAYQPLVDYLNGRLRGPRVVLEASTDYAAFEAKYRKRDPEILLPNPVQTLEAMGLGYRVIATAGENADFKGLFIVRKDGGIKKLGDLRGKTLSYPSSTALAACIMPQFFLHRNGIDVLHDITNRYVGSQESSIMNAYLGLSAAGLTWPPPWRSFQRDHPAEAAELRVAWETETLVNNSVMVRDDLPEALVKDLRALLVALNASARGRKILDGMETRLFPAATNGSYDRVREYVSRFEREVRPIW